MPTEKELKEESRLRIERIHTVLLGVEGTDDGGMAQDIKELREQGKKRNGRIGRLEIGLATLIGTLSGLGILDYAVFNKVFGG